MVEIVGRVEKEWKFKQPGWGLAFKLLFSFFPNNESYSIKNICVYSKSKIKPEVTNKQNLEHFKVINWTLLSLKFFSNSKILLSSSWAVFIRACVCAFVFTKGQLFFAEVLVLFVSTSFFQFILQKSLNRKTIMLS